MVPAKTSKLEALAPERGQTLAQMALTWVLHEPRRVIPSGWVFDGWSDRVRYVDWSKARFIPANVTRFLLQIWCCQRVIPLNGEFISFPGVSEQICDMFINKLFAMSSPYTVIR